MATISRRIRSLCRGFVLLIGLSTPASRIIVLLSGILLLAVLPTAQLPLLPIRSLYAMAGFYPYSTGMTRALSSLLHGQFGAAWDFNPLVYLLAVVVAVILVKDVCTVYRKREFSF